MKGENSFGKDLESIDTFYAKHPELNVKADTTKPDWEEEFDTQFAYFHEHYAKDAPTEKLQEVYDMTKNWVRHILATQKQQLKEKVEGMKIKHPYCHDGCPEDGSECAILVKNDVLDNILSVLDESSS